MVLYDYKLNSEKLINYIEEQYEFVGVRCKYIHRCYGWTA